jgi:antitoxin VapB
MRMAKVFMSWHSQAVRLPKDFIFHSKEVAIEKKGNKLILWELPENLAAAYDLLTSLPQDLFADGRVDTPPKDREEL